MLIEQEGAVQPRAMVETCGSYEFAMEPMSDELVAELRPLNALHWQETEAYRHGLPLNPDYAMLQALNRAGRYTAFTVRRDGVLVGECLMHLFLNSHTQLLSAKEDTLFVHPDHRVGRLAFKFVQYVRRCLERLGARDLTVSVKIGTRGENFFERMGFRLVAHEYHIYLGEA